MKYVRGVRIKRGFEIVSDNYLLTKELAVVCQRVKKKKSGSYIEN
jgi:hypothetical protein